MIGLRKVVNLCIHDIPQEKAVINRKMGLKKSLRYSWRNTYYIGDTKIYKTPLYSSEYRRPFYVKKCNDIYLNKIISKITKGDNNILENMDEYTDGIYYTNNESSIFYEGDNIEKVKRKLRFRRK